MKFWLRLLWLVLSVRSRPRCAPLGPCESRFRVWPNDLDVFLHVNNGVYLTLADLGRMDLLLRSGAFATVRAKRWYPVVAAETIRFRRSLKLGERYTIETEVIGWSDRAIYFRQDFRRGTDLIAELLLDIRMLRRAGGAVPSDEIRAAFGLDRDSPPLPEYLQAWLHSVEAASIDSPATDAVAV